MIVDGKKIAEDILVQIGDTLRGKTLGIVAVQGEAAIESFIKIKSRTAERLGVSIVRGELSDLVKTCDGVLVQLPHPDAEALLPQLLPEKDVDALGPAPLVEAPVAAAVQEILARYGATAKSPGQLAVAVGEGRLVGKPVAAMLRRLDYHVSVVTTDSGSLSILKDADIVVSGAGSPGLIKPRMLKPGVILIDAGTSESQGKVAGDADPACAEVASVFTPVPGGVGPIAVAMLFKNLATLVQK